MAKKFTASSEVLRPDSKFNSKLVSKFINCMMWGGKKSAAQNAFYDAMEIAVRRSRTFRLWRSSKPRSTTSSRHWRFAASESAAPAIRSPCR
jgi:hypothetical protein